METHSEELQLESGETGFPGKAFCRAGMPLRQPRCSLWGRLNEPLAGGVEGEMWGCPGIAARTCLALSPASIPGVPLPQRRGCGAVGQAVEGFARPSLETKEILA